MAMPSHTTNSDLTTDSIRWIEARRKAGLSHFSDTYDKRVAPAFDGYLFRDVVDLL